MGIYYRDAEDVPRFEPPEDEPEQEGTCGECKHYCELQRVNGKLTEYIGVCCVERDDSADKGTIYQTEPSDRPESVDCTAWERA